MTYLTYLDGYKYFIPLRPEYLRLYFDEQMEVDKDCDPAVQQFAEDSLLTEIQDIIMYDNVMVLKINCAQPGAQAPVTFIGSIIMKSTCSISRRSCNKSLATGSIYLSTDSVRSALQAAVHLCGEQHTINPRFI